MHYHERKRGQISTFEPFSLQARVPWFPVARDLTIRHMQNVNVDEDELSLQDRESPPTMIHIRGVATRRLLHPSRRLCCGHRRDVITSRKSISRKNNEEFFKALEKNIEVTATNLRSAKLVHFKNMDPESVINSDTRTCRRPSTNVRTATFRKLHGTYCPPGRPHGTSV